MPESAKLHHWFLENQREFPWRKEKSPYFVWVSEVMLQQTRASVVIDYFNRWIKLFPTVEKLAEAELNAVIKAWEGLGYYSRARRLHSGAKEIMKRFGGKIPETYEELDSIQGLGPYTIGAILSFGFHKKAVAIDGNVLRVASRYFSISENISKVKTKKEISEKVEAFLDPVKPWVTTEALIELGALVCGRKPLCSECPIKAGCKGYELDIAESLPIKNAQAETIRLKRWVLILEANGSFLVKIGESGKVMADLYEFPYFEKEDELLSFCEDKTRALKSLKTVTHTFTKYRAKLVPRFFSLKEKRDIPGFIWAKKDEIEKLPFSAGHRLIMKEIL